MKIAALTKQSFIDWEGQTTAVIFTQGCNFRCGYCHNPSLVLPHIYQNQPLIDEQEVFDYLKSRVEWLDGVVISGGEPTLQPDLLDFVRKVKSLGFRVKLDTNGSNPHVLKALLDAKLLDYVAMDIKTLLTRDNYRKITGLKNSDVITLIKQSLALLRQENLEYQLRTTIIPNHHNDCIINKLKIQFANDNYVIQQYREAETVADLSQLENV